MSFEHEESLWHYKDFQGVDFKINKLEFYEQGVRVSYNNIAVIF